MQDTGEGPLKKVTLLDDGESSEAIYDEWAAAYEHDLVGAYGYVSPTETAARLASMLPDRSTPIVDYGCGTGLVGVPLADLGFTTIDGVDVSAAMLDEARAKGCYRALHRLDLTQPLPSADGQYGALVCVGVMGAGHLVPEDFAELFRTVRAGGPIVLYGNGTTYERDGYDDRFRALEVAGHWTTEARETSNYMTTIVRPGVLLAGRAR